LSINWQINGQTISREPVIRQVAFTECIRLDIPPTLLARADEVIE